MNNDRRKRIENVKTSIEELRSLLETLQGEEAAIEALGDAAQACEEIKGHLDTAVE